MFSEAVDHELVSGRIWKLRSYSGAFLYLRQVEANGLMRRTLRSSVPRARLFAAYKLLRDGTAGPDRHLAENIVDGRTLPNLQYGRETSQARFIAMSTAQEVTPSNMQNRIRTSKLIMLGEGGHGGKAGLRFAIQVMTMLDQTPGLPEERFLFYEPPVAHAQRPVIVHARALFWIPVASEFDHERNNSPWNDCRSRDEDAAQLMAELTRNDCIAVAIYGSSHLMGAGHLADRMRSQLGSKQTVILMAHHDCPFLSTLGSDLRVKGKCYRIGAQDYCVPMKNPATAATGRADLGTYILSKWDEWRVSAGSQ